LIFSGRRGISFVASRRASGHATELVPRGEEGANGMYAYFGAIWNCRYFWLSLVRMDLRSRYRGSVLGIGWSLLHPIAITVILCTVFSKMLNQNVEEYAPYLFAGLTFWNYWVAVAVQGCDCFFQGEAYIRQFPAPMAIYPLRTTLASAFHFCVGLFLVLGLSWWYHGWVNPLALLSLIPTLGLLLLFGWCVALLFGLATVRFRDTRHLTDVGMQALFYMTPIMYRPEMLNRPRLSHLLQMNPLMPFLNLLREPMVNGRVPSTATYGTACIILMVLAVVASVALMREERRLIFHL
jgi:ABC-type polysaccharide/polyol phosphate export permease